MTSSVEAASSRAPADRVCPACDQLNFERALYCGACGATLGAPATPEAAIRGARSAFERGDIMKARHTLEEQLTATPADKGARLAYAAVLLQDREFDAGLEQLELIRVSGWDPVVEAYVGGALLGLGRISEAQDTLDEAYRQADGNFYVLLKRGELYCRLGIFAVAIEALQRAVKVNNEDRLGHEAARRLLRFARDKAGKGFTRTSVLPSIKLAVKWPFRTKLAAVPGSPAQQTWG